MSLGKNIFSNREIQWIDVPAPSQTQYNELSELLALPESIIQNCLNPDYLPHLETYGSTRFVILRIPEPVSNGNADSVQELTTKIAIFIRDHHVISIHRITDLHAIKEVATTVNALSEEYAKDVNALTVLGLFFEQVALAFENPINQLEAQMEKFEENIFNHKRSKALLQEGYYIKRKASAYRKVLKYTLDTLSRLGPKELWQDSRDKLERYQFYADDIFENTQGLLGLHLSIASQRTNEASFRTNEIMRVLTVLTIFFLPLNFIAGVFGMNFVHIPGLQHEWGFWISIGLMLVISIALFIYIAMKGWLSPVETNENYRK
ncbi:hypothetical protein CIK05_10640 [Bdellovibrio sp. qaytius]|nr:hypothetical protein CIK05_10640 [Bdellovibrio sp. qaytius]